MEILKVKITRKNNATTREVLEYELPILEAMFPGGQSDGDVIVLNSRPAKQEEIARFLRRPEDAEGVLAETDDTIPDVKLAFMNLSARYEGTKIFDQHGNGIPVMEKVYPSENAFRRAWAEANPEQGKKKAAA